MHSRHARIRALEGYVSQRQRKTPAGLIALLETGTLSVQQLTDAELETVIRGLGGDIHMPDMAALTDAELEAIIAHN